MYKHDSVNSKTSMHIEVWFTKDIYFLGLPDFHGFLTFRQEMVICVGLTDLGGCKNLVMQI